MHCPTVAVMTSPTGRRTRAGRLRLPVALLGATILAATGALLAPGTAAHAATPTRTVEEKVQVAAGPGLPDTIPLDTTLYLPATTPAPAVLVAHGFGGTKASVDADARGAGRPRVRRAHVDGARLRRQRRADRARLPGLRGGGRPRAGRLAGRASRGGAGRSGRPAGGRHRRVVRRGARAAAGRLRPADRRAGAGDHVERPGPGAVPERRGRTGCAAGRHARPRRLRPGRGVQARLGRGVLLRRSRPGRRPRRGGRGSDGSGGGRRGPSTHRRAHRTQRARHLRPLHRRRLRRLHRGRHHRAALPRHRGAPAPLLPRVGHGPDHRADAGRAGRGGHAVRPGPGRRHRPADRRGRRHGARALVRRRPRRRRARTSACATRSATWFDHWLAGRGDPPATDFGYTVASGVRTGGDTPTSRTVEAPAYPGLGGAPAVSTAAAPAVGRSAGRAGARRRQPRRDHLAARARRRAGQLGSRVAAFTAELPGQSAAFRTAPVAAPLLVAGAPRVDLAVARVPGQPAPDEAVLFAKVYEVAADGTRTLLGGAVAPVRVAVPADGSSAQVTVTLPGVVAPIEAGNRLMVSVGTTDQGFAGTTDPRGLADRARRTEAGGALTVPCRARRGRHREHRAARGRCSASPACRRGAARDWWSPGCAAGGSGTGRRSPGRPTPRTAVVSRRPGRWRSATSPRPTAAGSAPSRACRSTSSGAWCWACSGRTAPARRPCCAC